MKNNHLLRITNVCNLTPQPDKYYNLAIEVLKCGLPVTIKVNGISMKPFILDGDTAVIHPFCKRGIHFGDVVLCIHAISKKVLLHRVVEIKRNQVLIKGDANISVDGYISSWNIFGYVTCIIRNGVKIQLSFGTERKIVAFLTKKGIVRLINMVIDKYRFLGGKFERDKCRYDISAGIQSLGQD